MTGLLDFYDANRRLLNTALALLAVVLGGLPLVSSAGWAVVKAGDPSRSELVRRITTDDIEDMMPPPDSSASLMAAMLCACAATGRRAWRAASIAARTSSARSAGGMTRGPAPRRLRTSATGRSQSGTGRSTTLM